MEGCAVNFESGPIKDYLCPIRFNLA